MKTLQASERASVNGGTLNGNYGNEFVDIVCAESVCYVKPTTAYAGLDVHYAGDPYTVADYVNPANYQLNSPSTLPFGYGGDAPWVGFYGDDMGNNIWSYYEGNSWSLGTWYDLVYGQWHYDFYGY